MIFPFESCIFCERSEAHSVTQRRYKRLGVSRGVRLCLQHFCCCCVFVDVCGMGLHTSVKAMQLMQQDLNPVTSCLDKKGLTRLVLEVRSVSEMSVCVGPCVCAFACLRGGTRVYPFACAFPCFV